MAKQSRGACQSLKGLGSAVCWGRGAAQEVEQAFGGGGRVDLKELEDFLAERGPPEEARASVLALALELGLGSRATTVDREGLFAWLPAVAQPGRGSSEAPGSEEEPGPKAATAGSQALGAFEVTLSQEEFLDASVLERKFEEACVAAGHTSLDEVDERRIVLVDPLGREFQSMEDVCANPPTSTFPITVRYVPVQEGGAAFEGAAIAPGYVRSGDLEEDHTTFLGAQGGKYQSVEEEGPQVEQSAWSPRKQQVQEEKEEERTGSGKAEPVQGKQKCGGFEVKMGKADFEVEANMWARLAEAAVAIGYGGMDDVDEDYITFIDAQGRSIEEVPEDAPLSMFPITVKYAPLHGKVIKQDVQKEEEEVGFEVEVSKADFYLEANLLARLEEAAMTAGYGGIHDVDADYITYITCIDTQGRIYQSIEEVPEDSPATMFPIRLRYAPFGQRQHCASAQSDGAEEGAFGL